MMHVAQEFVLSSEQYKPCVAFYVRSRRLVGSRKKAVEHLSGASCVTLASLFCCAFALVTLSFPAPKQAFTLFSFFRYPQASQPSVPDPSKIGTLGAASTYCAKRLSVYPFWALFQEACRCLVEVRPRLAIVFDPASTLYLDTCTQQDEVSAALGCLLQGRD